MATTHTPASKFLRWLVLGWLIAVGLTLAGAVLAPHAGRLLDFVLWQTAYRRWQPLRLDTQRPFFDLSRPELAVKSYYSALYRGDRAHMARLTTGALQAAMQHRLAQAAPVAMRYRSYLYLEHLAEAEARVLEKFHLFWRRGLRFHLQREAGEWRLAEVTLLP